MINGKFVAGMAVIGLVLLSVVGLIAGFGMLRLGIIPHESEVMRLVAWVLATFLYVALWLAFGLLLSVVVRRAATAALIGFGVWLLVTVFGGPDHHDRDRVPPASPRDADVNTILGNAQLQQFISRLMPGKLYPGDLAGHPQPVASPRSAPRPRSRRSSRASSGSTRC